ncbi:unnamed protein product [Cylicocyclus nassatus]|uniref:Uncharacterized protein n=1 Tax=Cylicocyclus nassatus TaxID=53992 RepID=A0AA36GMN9_CYLNA|nr:unnamed protein product [Cylicocyclus nassatus]
MATSSSDASAASEASSSSGATSTTTEANVIDEELLKLCKKMNDSSTKYACKRDGKHFSKVSECESHCRDRPELCRLEHIDNEDKLICVRNRSISYDVWDQRKCEEECSEIQIRGSPLPKTTTVTTSSTEAGSSTEAETTTSETTTTTEATTPTLTTTTSTTTTTTNTTETPILSSITTTSSEVTTTEPMTPPRSKLIYF